MGRIGPHGEIARSVRASIAGTKSGCDLGQPDPEARAEWRERQKPRELGRVPAAELVFRGDAELSNEISDRLFDEAYATGVGAMTVAERNLYFVEVLSGEVDNGGFHQYFFNSSGDCAMQTKGATRAIDPQLADLFERAIAKFPNSAPPEDRATRNSEMERIPDEFHAWSMLDDEFYKLQMLSIEVRYIRANKDLFDGPMQSL